MPSVLTPPRPILLITLFLLLAAGIPAPCPAAENPWRVKAILKVGGEIRPLTQPSGLFLDPAAGKVYVADPENNRLLSFTPAGEFLAEFTAGGSLRRPADLLKDDKGIFRVLEFGYPGFIEVDAANRRTTRHELKAGKSAVYPRRIAPAPGGFLVLDKISGAIILYGETFEEVSTIGCPDQGGFKDFNLSGGGILALSARNIHRYSMTGQHLGATPLPPELEFATSLASDSGGLVYLLDRHAGKVAVLQPEGALLYTFLQRGENEGDLLYPSLIRFDSDNGLWIVDEGNNRVMVLRK